MVQFQIAVVVYKVVNASFEGWTDIRNEAKIETLRQKNLLCSFAFIIRTEHFKDSAVLSKPVVDVSNDVISIGIEPVVKTVPAEIAAKLLIKSARDGLSAFLAIFHVLLIGRAPEAWQCA